MTGKSRWGDCNFKFCILCYLQVLMGVCIIYARGYKYSSSQLRARNTSPASESTYEHLCPIFTNKTHKLSIEFLNWFLFYTISCRSTGLMPALSGRSRVAPKRTLSLSAFSAKSDSIFNALGAISAKLWCNSSVIPSAHSLRSLQAWLRNAMYECLCIQPSLLLPDGLQSEHTIKRIPVFD